MTYKIQNLTTKAFVQLSQRPTGKSHYGSNIQVGKLSHCSVAWMSNLFDLTLKINQ